MSSMQIFVFIFKEKKIFFSKHDSMTQLQEIHNGPNNMWWNG